MRIKGAGFIVSAALLLVSVFAYGAGEGTSCSGGCHIIKPYEDGVADQNLLVNRHFKAGITCTDCHERTKEDIEHEKEVFKSGDYEKPLYTREYDADFCFRCHGDYKSLADGSAELTERLGRNPHKSHMGDVPCSECHKVHQPSKFVCSECHKSKWDEKLPQGWLYDK